MHLYKVPSVIAWAAEVRDAKDAAISRNGNFWSKKSFFETSATKINEMDFKTISSQNFAKLKKKKSSQPNLLVNSFLVLNHCLNKYLILS